MFDLCRTVSFLTLLESSPSLVEVWWLSTTLHSEMLTGNPRALLSVWVCYVFISKKISLCFFLPPCVPSCSVPQWFPCSSQTLWELFLIHVSAELKEKKPHSLAADSFVLWSHTHLLSDYYEPRPGFWVVFLTVNRPERMVALWSLQSSGVLGRKQANKIILVDDAAVCKRAAWCCDKEFQETLPW